MSVIVDAAGADAQSVDVMPGDTVGSLLKRIHDDLALRREPAAYDVSVLSGTVEAATTFGGDEDCWKESEDRAARIVHTAPCYETSLNHHAADTPLADLGIYGLDERVTLSVKFAHIAREWLEVHGVVNVGEARRAVEAALAAGASAPTAARIDVEAAVHTGCARLAPDNSTRTASNTCTASSGEGGDDGPRKPLVEVSPPMDTHATLQPVDGVPDRTAAGEPTVHAAASGAPEPPPACGGGSLSDPVEVLRMLMASGILSKPELHRRLEKFMYDAAREGHAARLRWGLSADADGAMHGAMDRSALGCAVAHGHLDAARALLQHGVKVNGAADQSGRTAMWHAVELGEAGVACIDVLAAHGARVDALDEYGCTPLWAVASDAGCALPTVAALLRHAANPNARGEGRSTPLWCAAHAGRDDVVAALLQHGARVDAANHVGCTPLATAARRGHVSTVRLLLDHGAAVDEADEDGATPLWGAAKHGMLDVVEVLIAKGAEVDRADGSGGTPLWAAALDGHVDVVKRLLAEGARVDARDKHGDTPLWCAVYEGHADAVAVLTAHGASAMSANRRGDTPLRCAEQTGQRTILRLLLAQDRREVCA